MLQYPFDLGGGEVGVNEQSRAVLNILGELLVLFQLLTQRGGAAALPHDSVVDRPPGMSIPHDGRFPLVCDADSSHLIRRNAGLGQHFGEDGVLTGPDLHGVMLHPAGLGVYL